MAIEYLYGDAEVPKASKRVDIGAWLAKATEEGTPLEGFLAKSSAESKIEAIRAKYIAACANIDFRVRAVRTYQTDAAGNMVDATGKPTTDKAKAIVIAVRSDQKMRDGVVTRKAQDLFQIVAYRRAATT